MNKKIIASFIIAGILLCGTNLNVFATEEREVDEKYKTLYESDAEMQIIESQGRYLVSASPSDADLEWEAQKVNAVVYTTTDTFLRKGVPNENNKDELLIEADTQMVQVGQSKNGWDLVRFNDETYFVWCKNLCAATKDVVTAIPEVKEYSSTFVEAIEETPAPAYDPYSFKSMGVINWGGYRWTYYSQRVLPGGGLRIPGRHVGPYGFVCDEDGYICLASTSVSYGTVVDTPFGMKGKVYDCGCAAGTMDCYCDW